MAGAGRLGFFLSSGPCCWTSPELCSQAERKPRAGASRLRGRWCTTAHCWRPLGVRSRKNSCLRLLVAGAGTPLPAGELQSHQTKASPCVPQCTPSTGGGGFRGAGTSAAQNALPQTGQPSFNPRSQRGAERLSRGRAENAASPQPLARGCPQPHSGPVQPPKPPDHPGLKGSGCPSAASLRPTERLGRWLSAQSSCCPGSASADARLIFRILRSALLARWRRNTPARLQIPTADTGVTA